MAGEELLNREQEPIREPAPETRESLPERKDAWAKEHSVSPETPSAVHAPSVPQTSVRPASSAVDPWTGAVERILEQGLESYYHSMDEVTRQEFRVRGEETASRIALLLRGVSVKVQKIIALVRGWLALIPGVSKLFIEQEAKLKADRLLALRRREDGNGE